MGLVACAVAGVAMSYSVPATASPSEPLPVPGPVVIKPEVRTVPPDFQDTFNMLVAEIVDDYPDQFSYADLKGEFGPTIAFKSTVPSSAGTLIQQLGATALANVGASEQEVREWVREAVARLGQRGLRVMGTEFDLRSRVFVVDLEAGDDSHGDLQKAEAARQAVLESEKWNDFDLSIRHMRQTLSAESESATALWTTRCASLG